MPAHHRGCKVFEVDAKAGLHSATTRDDSSAFQGPSNSTQTVMDRPFHFIEEIIVGSAQNDGRRRLSLGPLDKDAFVIGDAFLRDLVCVTQ